MSWLLSSPGSVLAMQTWLSFEGVSRTTVKREMSPSNSCTRLTAQGDIRPVSRRPETPYFSSSTGPIRSGSNRPSGDSNTGLIWSPAFST